MFSISSIFKLNSIRSFSTSAFLFKEIAKKTRTKATTKTVKSKAKSKESAGPTTLRDQKLAAKPKRPANAYALYFKDKYAEAKLSNEKILLKEEASRIGKLWNGESESVKTKYAELAKPATELYRKEVEAWKSTFKRKPNAYNMFISLNFDKSKAHSRETSSAEIAALAKKWGTLTPAEKESYKSKI